MSSVLDESALDRLFREARTRNAWAPERLGEDTLRKLYDLVKFGPTAMNTSPARFVFVTSDEGKARLTPHLMEGNRAKSQAASAVVIVATDTAFYERLPELFPMRPNAKDMFVADPELAQSTAFRSSTLQGGYLIMAARALGLDAGPMSGFDNAGVDAEFFAGSTLKSNFICAIGHATDTPHPRLPRLSFEDACQVV